jgi:hypothetical protein
MLKGKKCHIMRHPYLTLAVLGLAATGAVAITNRVRGFLTDKTRCVGNMVKSIRMDENI